MCMFGKKKRRGAWKEMHATSNDTKEHFNGQIFDNLNVSVCPKSVIIMACKQKQNML